MALRFAIFALLVVSCASDRIQWETLREDFRDFYDVNISRPTIDDVQFFLFTSSNPEVYQLLVYNDTANLLESNFNPNNPTKILIHGLGDQGNTTWIHWMTRSYLSLGEYNMISVDWGALAQQFYFNAAHDARLAGQRAAEYMKFIMQTFPGIVTLEDFHPIGFSLGGQVLGFLGQQFNGTLPRLSALDPAGFLFHTVPLDEKLDIGDAQFIDVTHSAGLWIGTDEKVGHVDFYPNSGKANQPGCETESIGLPCSHARAPRFFDESITSLVGFEAVKCDSWENFEAGLCDDNERNYLGDPADPSVPGDFYLRTNAESPYAIPLNKWTKLYDISIQVV